MHALSQQVLRGERKAISKAITSVENRDKDYQRIMKDIFRYTGKAFIIGVTGPLGTGKSSLVNELVKIYRERNKKVAVLAVDPSSMVSGGAILGDRVRMLGHALDSSVYIRSMASRGDEGGLSKSAKDAVRILDAAGNDVIIVETVGIGQTEVEIVSIADVVVIVLMPELGDEIQAIKAGLMEIGDIFAINKSDLPGADKVLLHLAPFLARRSDGWKQSAIKVSAKTGDGLNDLVSKLDEYKTFLEKYSSSGKSEEKKEILREELIDKVTSSISSEIRSLLLNDNVFKDLVQKIFERRVDPETASGILLEKYRLTNQRSEK